MSLWRPYFVRRWRFGHEGGEESLVVGGVCVNDLLRRRWVMAYAGSAEAQKTGCADDVMKEVVAEATSDVVEPVPEAGTREWEGFGVAPDWSQGPEITKGFAWRQLLTPAGGGVLPSLAEAAREAGTEVFFEVGVAAVTAGSIALEFRTFTGQPGRDRAGTVFALERGNLRDPALVFDYSEEENYVYGAGPGQEADRQVEQEYDAARYGVSKWNRCEGVADARNEEGDGVREVARARMSQGRGRVSFAATLVDTRGTRFGIHWDLGDRVRAVYREMEFEAMVRGAAIELDGEGRDTISGRFDYEGAAP